MQIVIDIPDALARYIMNDYSYPTEKSKQELMDAVYEGKPLSKGHGRLIDADLLFKEERRLFERSQHFRISYSDVFLEIFNAPTVIEADRVSK